ncbi:phosphoglycerate dehydrogenase [Fulvivirgaceae bacterium BMA10]|uniref:D-3-phosphoglycerate dehydrogenase n=1 Tax=Splendidivirga corallicola TaxID=3051826 RepID=A0ABT8KJH3_9BACT|nr:phosphoglycerate dehydrogenase [Fulvivirgaceae bacterium BMA10]
MPNNKYFVIDFDSTFTKVEALDVLCEISLEERSEKGEVLQKIQEITDRGMAGEISLRESLEERIDLLKANKRHISELVTRLRKSVSNSFKRNTDFFNTYSERIFIISNGFKDFIVPIVSEYGIKEENVYANSFKFDQGNNIIGFDEDNVLSANQGKVKVLESLKLQGEVLVIGDGYTDYEIKEGGQAKKFYAFTENIERGHVLEKADHVTPSLDEFLYVNKMNTAISYPKNRIKVLLLENIHKEAIRLMKEEGYKVETYGAGLDEDELAEKIKDVSILGIRSKTQVTAKVLENANRLIAIGAFCIGTNQIDLEAALKKGVAVYNAPYSNTRSVVELAVAEIIFLMRNLPDKINRMHEGVWEKSANQSYEIRGKKLGIIGYGNIGSQLSVLSESMGLDVYYYDIVERLSLGNATKCSSLDQLLAVSDIVTLHVDGRGDNYNMIGRNEFSKMKDGTIFLNLSRGHIVDIQALREAIESGKIRGAAVDVFPDEPKSNHEELQSELRGLPNTILTPHIGGSTIEAQINIANFVPNQIMDYINTGSTTNSVNFPNLQLPEFKNAHRLVHIHHNIPGVLAHINNTLANFKINIVGQYLKTNESIGYVITDIDKEYDKEVIKKLKKVEGTIKLRTLY